MRSKQRPGRKRRLRVGDTAWVRLTPTATGVERIANRLNREPNVSDFIRRLILAEIEREERPNAGNAVDVDLLATLVCEVVQKLNGQPSIGPLQTRLSKQASPVQLQDPPELPLPAVSPPAAAGRTTRGRDQLHRLLAED